MYDNMQYHYSFMIVPVYIIFYVFFNFCSILNTFVCAYKIFSKNAMKVFEWNLIYELVLPNTCSAYNNC